MLDRAFEEETAWTVADFKAQVEIGGLRGTVGAYASVVPLSHWLIAPIVPRTDTCQPSTCCQEFQAVLSEGSILGPP